MSSLSQSKLLIGIVALGAILRFYNLGTVPVGLHRDEAFLGYNAYSIAKTGKDMSNNFLPIHLQSFLYSPAGYAYSSIPWISLFGPSPFSVRFSSALFGTLTVILTYVLVMELFGSSRLALLSSFLLSISPWHITLSRTATENILVVFFIILGVLLYRSRHLLLAFASFALTLIIYQAPRAFLPLFIPFVILLFRHKGKRAASTILPIFLLVVTILLPIYFIVRSPNLSLRLKTVSLLATEENQLVIDERAREDGVLGIPVLITRLFHNKIRSYAEQFFQNYFAHFTYDFLFADKGLPDRYRVPGAGLIYLIELPFILLAVSELLKSDRREQKILIPWLLLGFVGSALTFDDVPNLQRTLLVFPTIPILSAFGAIQAYTLLQSKRNYANLFLLLFSLGLSYFFLSYLHAYYSHQVVHRPWYRQEGYAGLVKAVNRLLPEYEKAVITNRETAPAIFFLFYGAYDPTLFQKETMGLSIKDYDRVNFANYEFSQEECPFQEKELPSGARVLSQPVKPRTLYVNWGNCAPVKTFGNVIQTIRRNDGTPVFTLVSQ